MNATSRLLLSSLLSSLVLPAAIQLSRLAAARRSVRQAGGRRWPRVYRGASGRHCLLLGDSVALGLGASEPARTLAGQLRTDFSEVNVECRAQPGARGRDLSAQLAGAQKSRYAAIIVSIGGNDIVRGTPDAEFRRQLADALRACTARSRCVIVANCANLGGAPLFLWPVRLWLDARSRRFRRIMRALCPALGAQFVNYCMDADNDIFRRSPERFYAPDRIHPSDYAYRLSYLYLSRATPLASVLAR
ncbi:MAG: GDSL-type esterase/lipase family protein [Burkholderiaceae bacterium]|nr:GDSL-type esterase/lipase family protein [Burkholderiaceae bacterium]